MELFLNNFLEYWNMQSELLFNKLKEKLVQ